MLHTHTPNREVISTRIEGRIEYGGRNTPNPDVSSRSVHLLHCSSRSLKHVRYFVYKKT